jgi:hypothetical protein
LFSIYTFFKTTTAGVSPVTSGLASPQPCLSSLTSPLTTPRGTPRTTPTPGGHRIISEEDYTTLLQNIVTSQIAGGNGSTDEQSLLKEGNWDPPKKLQYI